MAPKRKRRSFVHAFLAALFGLLLVVILLLAVEGVASFWFGKSLLRSPLDPAAALVDGWSDAQRARLADLTPGPFALDRDPEVGHLTKARTKRQWGAAQATTDEFGMRQRPEGWPKPDRPRWVVLGDSVAFGLGVADDQTYAARIEAHLASVWCGAGPSPAVMTVGVPGWNLEASTRFLRNHLHRYDPSLVVLMPVDNDLESRSVVTESGGRSYGMDPAVGSERIYTTTEAFYELYAALSKRAPLERVAAVFRDGGLSAVEYILTSGLAPESDRRYGEAVSAVGRLRRDLRERDCELFVLFGWSHPFYRLMDDRLRRAEPNLPRGFLFDSWQREDAFADDGHPNAGCIDAGAILTVQLLQSHGLLPSTVKTSSLQVPKSYADRIVEPLSEAASDAWLVARRKLLESHSAPRVSFEDAMGFNQIYGGLEPDGTMGRQARFALLGQGGERELKLRILAPTSGVVVRHLELGCAFAAEAEQPDTELVWLPVKFAESQGGSELELRLPLPEGLSTDGWIDVNLIASDHLVETIDGRSRLASLRVVEVAIVD